MRAKMKLNKIEQHEQSETLHFAAVSKTGSYPADGTDEDNTFAKFSPNATLQLTVTNPALLGTFKPGEKYYVDFTKAE